MKFLTRFVKNVRHGFATNSSSSHALVYLNNPDAVDDDLPYGNEFGWNMFHAFTMAGKAAYYRAQSGSWDSAEGYVDHQSLGTLSHAALMDPNIGVIGGNDNSDNTYEEIAELATAGVINLDKMVELGLIEDWTLQRVKEYMS